MWLFELCSTDQGTTFLIENTLQSEQFWEEVGFLRQISLKVLLLRVSVPPLPEQGFFHSRSFKLSRSQVKKVSCIKGFFPHL